jgi:hypothetical protein
MLNDLAWLLTRFDWTLLPRLIWSNIRRQGASASSLTLTNTSAFFVPLDSTWSGRPLEVLLKRHGIQMIGWDITRQQFYFYVPSRQAKWSYYVMARAGVPLEEQR